MNNYVLVSGDFNTCGGMDRANYELAWYLADQTGAKVHLVSHFVAPPLVNHPRVIWHRVAKPFNRHAFAGSLLTYQGRRVASALADQGARVIVNGGNCAWPDVNWVHAVHAVWKNRDDHAPVMHRLHASLTKYTARHAERRSLRVASLILTNSLSTRRQVIHNLGITSERVHTVYLGIDPEVFHPATPEEQIAARRSLGFKERRPLVAFIGALGHDRNKGFDVLFSAWELLCKDSSWDVDLVALGKGAEVNYWRGRAAGSGLNERVLIVGFTKRVRDILAAADALVSPTHYEAYGLGVHEALCCGLPAFVTRTAGIAERYTEDVADLLLNDPPDTADLIQRLRRWRKDMVRYSAHVSSFGGILRQHTWADMSREIVDLIDAFPPADARQRF